MRVINIEGRWNRKPRGLKRKTVSMLKDINASTSDFPLENLERGYWHMHLPVSQVFIDSSKTPSGIRRKCVQQLIDRTQHLIEIKTKSEHPIRVVTAISLPDIWDSQIIVFFGNIHWDGFFVRDSEEQRWTELPENRNIVKEWSLRLPRNFEWKGYKQTINDEDFHSESELWYFGELS